MGGLMRGSMHQGNNNSSKGRYYGLMVMVVAFGAALLIGGIMFLHRVKERRIFNLILKDKDSHLTSLQLLLQKERALTKEAKWKLADMRAKIYAVRAQKRELDNRVLEMQSTISSLKDEQRIIELALGEKQKEIKELREKQIEIDNQVPRVTALSEIIRQKEAEIEDLKRQLESTAKVQSVTTDDPSNAASHLPIRFAETDETGGNKNSEFGGELNKTTSNNNDEGSELHISVSRSEYANHQTGEQAREDADKVVGEGHNAEPFGEKSEKTDFSEKSGVEHGSTNITHVEKNNDRPQSEENEKDALNTEDDGNYKRVLRDEDEGHSNRNEVLVTRRDLPDQTLTANAREKQRSGVDDGDGTKLEIPHNSLIGSDRINDNHAPSRKRVRKRQNFVYRNWKNKGMQESNGVATRGERSSVGGVSQKEEKPQTSGHEEAHTSGDPSFKTSYALQKGGGSNQAINEETEKKHDERPADVEHNQEENNTKVNHNFPGGNGLPGHDVHASKEDPKQPAKNESAQLDEREITNDKNESTELLRAPWKDMATNMTTLNDNIKESPKARSEAQHEGEVQIHKSWEARSKVQSEREMQNQANGIEQLAEKVADHKDNKVPPKKKPGETDGDTADAEELEDTETETETSKESANDIEGGDEEYREF